MKLKTIFIILNVTALFLFLNVPAWAADETGSIYLDYISDGASSVAYTNRAEMPAPGSVVRPELGFKTNGYYITGNYLFGRLKASLEYGNLSAINNYLSIYNSESNPTTTKDADGDSAANSIIVSEQLGLGYRVINGRICKLDLGASYFQLTNTYNDQIQEDGNFSLDGPMYSIDLGLTFFRRLGLNLGGNVSNACHATIQGWDDLVNQNLVVNPTGTAKMAEGRLRLSWIITDNLGLTVSYRTQSAQIKRSGRTNGYGTDGNIQQEIYWTVDSLAAGLVYKF